jgi:hypothetical protein
MSEQFQNLIDKFVEIGKSIPLTQILYRYFNKRVRVMVFNTTFNNISVISRQSVLLVEDTGLPG